MSTYHIIFTVKGKQEYMAFRARTREKALAALQSLYGDVKLYILSIDEAL